MTPTRILIFAKAPQPGVAKTRLIPVLGGEGAAALARRMLANTLHAALAARIGPVELCVSPSIDDESWRGIAVPTEVETSDQGSGDLGARMARASARALAKSPSVLLIGTDCVEMHADLLCEAALALRAQSTVIYATADGGYALLGLSKYSPLLFSEMAWSTKTVAKETILRIEKLGWSLHVGRLLHDVDEAADLVLLPKEWVFNATI